PACTSNAMCLPFRVVAGETNATSPAHCLCNGELVVQSAEMRHGGGARNETDDDRFRWRRAKVPMKLRELYPSLSTAGIRRSFSCASERCRIGRPGGCS